MRTLVAALALCAVLPATAHASDTRPNLLLVFTDDQRHDAIGYAGNPAVHTPTLDRLARQGMIFRNCFVNTSICSVSRANILSGKYPDRHGIDDFFKEFSDTQLQDTVPGRLRRAGYQTAFVGKWGIGHSPGATHRGAAVFDYWAGQPMQTCYFHDANCRYAQWNGFRRPLDDLCDCPADAQSREGFRDRIGRAGLASPLHVDSQVTPLHVQRFVEGRDPNKPFCLMLFFKSPHSPFGDWDPAVERVTDGKSMPVPPSATLANAQKEPDIVRRSLGAPAGMRFLKDPDALQRHMRDYYRLIASMDLGLERVMKLLSDHGLADNTVVLFTSDNGHLLGEHGLGGKWLMYEPSLRVPGFLYDPRREGPTTTDRLVITTDFSATLLALADVPVPENMTGLDLRRLYEEPARGWREDFYYDHPYGHQGRIPRTVGIRGERFVYTRYIDREPPFEQLFDLKQDPDQLINLADHPDQAERLRSMRRRCDELARATGSEPR